MKKMNENHRPIPESFQTESSTKEVFISIIKDPTLLLDPANKLTLSEIKHLQDAFITLYKERPNICYLTQISDHFNDVLIVGDIHGDLNALIQIIQPFLKQQVQSIVFMGDYIDRGKHSIETLFFVLILTIVWPERILLLRGNHEDARLNQSFGLFNAILQLYPSDLIPLSEILTEIYQHFSLIAITPNKSVCLHGGIPIAPHILSEYLSIPKPHNLMKPNSDEYRIFMQILWNDPIEKITKETGKKSYHGYFYFSKEQIVDFLKEFKAKRIIRAHDPKIGYFKHLFKGKLNDFALKRKIK